MRHRIIVVAAIMLLACSVLGQTNGNQSQGVAATNEENEMCIAARRKAEQLGLNPLLMRLDKDGVASFVGEAKFTEVQGTFTLVEGDMLINVGDKPIPLAGGDKLQKGEYVTAKNGKVTKGTESFLGQLPPKSMQTSEQQRTIPDEALTLDSAYSAITKGETNTLVGRRVNWSIAPHAQEDNYIYAPKPSTSQGHSIWEGFMWVVPSTDGKTFALKINEGNPDKDMTRSREAMPTAKKGSIVHGTFGGVYENQNMATKQIPFLTDWQLDNGNEVATSAQPRSTKTVQTQQLPKKEETRKGLRPSFTQGLEGVNPVRVRNPNGFAVAIGIRSGVKGKDFDVPANGMNTVYIPDGRYDIYFVYSDKPDALFQGDSFTLNNNGVEIQIVKVVNGNYGIRQVK